ncbi:MAG: Gx transporter family protein [Spirochaetaceae bacterium]|nr:Gx transporter family protein [Spirochaetaceae bacterium]
MRQHSETSQADPEQAGTRFANTADVTALLGAFCFFLSSIEYMLPKPLPFMRLGIANLPILLAVDILPFPWYMLLAIVKVIGMSLISGTLFSFVALFSLAGTMIAALVMWSARKLGGKYISQIGVSVLGAISSNAIQIILARYVAFGEAALLIAPVFIAMGLLTGLALGLFAEHFAKVSRWYALASGRPMADKEPVNDIAEGEAPTAAPPRAKAVPERKAAAKAARGRRRLRFEAAFVPWQIALAGFVVAILFIIEKNLAIKISLLIFFILAAYMAGKHFSLWTTLAVSAGIILANLFVPSGKVLFQIGPLSITQFALTDGIMKAVTFEGLMFLSKASIMQGLRIPGTLGNIVSSSFLYYDRIIEYKGKIHASTLSSDVDGMMFAVWEHEAGVKVASPGFPVSGASPAAQAASATASVSSSPGDGSHKKGSLALAIIVAVVAVLVAFA